jgi:hypothetical protein
MKPPMLNVTTVRTSLALAAIAGFAMLVGTANCGSGGERTGTGGTGGGTGGQGASQSCTATPVLDCSNAYTLPDGHVVDFSATEWNNVTGKFCDAAGLRGSTYSYSGSGSDADGGVSAHTHSVDTTAGNFVLNLTAVASDYAGGGFAFEHCVNVSTFNAVRFTIALASGDLTGCDLYVQLKTFEQQASTQNPAGGCDESTTSCYTFPQATITVPLTATAQTVTVPFSALAPAAAGLPAPQQVVGLQWQIQSGAPLDPDGGAQIGCTAELRVDDIAFVTQ